MVDTITAQQRRYDYTLYYSISLMGFCRALTWTTPFYSTRHKADLLEHICVTVETYFQYFQLLNRTYFALLVVLLSNWAFILWVVHQFCLHDPLNSFNTFGWTEQATRRKRHEGGRRSEKNKNKDQWIGKEMK